MKLEKFEHYLQEHAPKGLKLETRIAGGVVIATVAASELPRLMFFLRDDAGCQFKQLIDICGVDFLERAERFEVVYQLLSLKANRRMTVKVCVGEGEPVPSMCKTFSCANWFEREVFDLFGITFSDHPDMRRILTDYGFEGHPLRKDFPLTGYVEVRYDDVQKKVVYEPVKLDQEFRNFDFEMPWEGTKYVLPDDVKATGKKG